MLFQKNKVRRSRCDLILDFTAYGYMVFVFLLLFAFALNSIANMTGSSIKGVDVLNSLAQIATALAFIFAVYQYRSNGEKERQIIISNEIKEIIVRMKDVCDEFKSNQNYNYQDINEFISLMTNLGTDLHALYEALEDDIYKAMIRIRWQDMHYNHLSKALKPLNIDHIFEINNLEKDFKGFSFIKAKFDEPVKSASELLKEYTFTLKVLKEMSIGEEIANQFNDIGLFETYYFDHDETNDLMFGLLSRLDLRVSSPLIAAVRDYKKKA